jgi:hypothetical protein
MVARAAEMGITFAIEGDTVTIKAAGGLNEAGLNGRYRSRHDLNRS